MKTEVSPGGKPATNITKNDRKAFAKVAGLATHAGSNVPGLAEVSLRIAADIATVLGRFDDNGNEKPGATP